MAPTHWPVGGQLLLVFGSCQSRCFLVQCACSPVGSCLVFGAWFCEKLPLKRLCALGANLLFWKLPVVWPRGHATGSGGHCCAGFLWGWCCSWMAAEVAHRLCEGYNTPLRPKPLAQRNDRTCIRCTRDLPGPHPGPQNHPFLRVEGFARD